MVNLNENQVLADARPISHIRVVVHTGAATDGSDNHWSIYLLLRAGGSVRVNMVTDYGEIDGRLEWSNLTYLLTNSAIRHWDYPVIMAIEVRHVADTIYRNFRHRYQFSGGGSGCRFWVSV
jgi:ferric iron reductase protein FhuF